MGETAKLHLQFPIAPHSSHCCLKYTLPPIYGKLVFHKTSARCQKGWELLERTWRMERKNNDARESKMEEDFSYLGKQDTGRF